MVAQPQPAAFAGDVKFAMSVKSATGTVSVSMDLSEMGDTTRTLDNVVAYMNGKLEAAGVASRMGREMIKAKRGKIINMFQDSEHERKPTITLSTVHKSKGREWQRVFILGRNMYMPSRYARQQWQLDQENNLIYVAITRSQNELVYVELEPKK